MRRIVPTTLAAFAVAGLLGACGSGDDADNGAADTTTTTSVAGPSHLEEFEAALFEFAQCMRDNGVADYPDPQVGEDGRIRVHSPADVGTDIRSPEYQAAEEACEDLRPEEPSEQGSLGTADSDWEKIVPGGDCVCADGSDFAFWERAADPTKVVFYLDGGGACFDATSCGFTGTGGESDFYNWSISGENPGFPGGGILNFDRAENPFADYSFIYVASCTGDADLGDVTREYSPELTVEHNGFVNSTSALAYLAEHYPDATQVVVVGNIGGSIAAPIYGGLVADLLSDAQVTVFGAGSGAYPDDPDFNTEVLGGLWGVYDNMPDWEVNEDLTASDWGIPRFWIQAGLHDPDIVMARFEFSFDPNAARAVASFGVDASDASDYLALIDANEATIEAAGVTQHSYIAPDEGHRLLELDEFYEMDVDGVTLVEWIEALLAGEPLNDVR